jgi:hypothetical protein
MIRWQLLVSFFSVPAGLAAATVCFGGMPALLPSTWTKESSPPSGTDLSNAAPYLQAISFFIVVLLVSAWAVKGLWNYLQKDIRWLPSLNYGRSLSLVVLWGLLFVVVLTMISGARELMTPGAWQKQGWTYQLAAPESQPPADSRAERRAALERLRLALWQYAATHEGRFPAENDTAFDQSMWDIPHWPGLRFLRTDEAKADDTGKLLVYEPELEGNDRQVILTSGLIGTMRSAEIRQALNKPRQP